MDDETSDMIREFCEKRNISFAEFCRYIQISQDFIKKLNRDTISFKEMMVIATVLNVSYEQTSMPPNSEKIIISNIM